jgi:hypothetical protein
VRLFFDRRRFSTKRDHPSGQLGRGEGLIARLGGPLVLTLLSSPLGRPVLKQKQTKTG